MRNARSELASNGAIEIAVVRSRIEVASESKDGPSKIFSAQSTATGGISNTFRQVQHIAIACGVAA